MTSPNSTTLDTVSHYQGMHRAKRGRQNTDTYKGNFSEKCVSTHPCPGQLIIKWDGFHRSKW